MAHSLAHLRKNARNIKISFVLWIFVNFHQVKSIYYVLYLVYNRLQEVPMSRRMCTYVQFMDT